MSTTDLKTESGAGAGSAKADGGSSAGLTDKVRETASAARDKAASAYEAARERTGTALDTARESVSKVGERTSSGIETNPVGALIGGLALGALLAAVLPKTRKEEELLGNVGRKINDTARDAARAATQAGREKLDELGLNQDAAKQKLADIAGDAGDALKSSAGAAAQSVKGSQPA